MVRSSVLQCGVIVFLTFVCINTYFFPRSISDPRLPGCEAELRAAKYSRNQLEHEMELHRLQPIAATSSATGNVDCKCGFAKTININVFTYNRLSGLQILLKSLTDADYARCPGRLSLTVFFDKLKPTATGHQTDLLDWLSSFHWPHGPFRIHMREKNNGLLGSISEAWYPTSHSEVAAFFEDDIEVSPHWFTFACNAIIAVGPEPPKRMIGVSLYRPIHDEMLQRPMGDKLDELTAGVPFLLQQPCSWGAVYFPAPWRYFRNWMRLQRENDVNPRLPFAVSSNSWDARSSWKKYLIKLMYDVGWYMIYPNLKDKAVLSTNHLMKGEHPLPKRHLFELPLLAGGRAAVAKALEVPPPSTMKVFDVKVRVRLLE